MGDGDGEGEGEGRIPSFVPVPNSSLEGMHSDLTSAELQSGSRGWSAQSLQQVDRQPSSVQAMESQLRPVVRHAQTVWRWRTRTRGLAVARVSRRRSVRVGVRERVIDVDGRWRSAIVGFGYGGFGRY